MRFDTIPPAGIGLLAGLLTSTAALILVMTWSQFSWVILLFLLLGGGLAAGLAAPVRPTTGAVLGAATGLFTATLITAALILPWNPALPQHSNAPLVVPIALSSLILYIPVHTVAGAVGAAVRPHLARPRAALGGLRSGALTGWQSAAIVVGALCIIAGTAVSALAQWVPSGIPILISAFAGGVAAGSLSRGGLRAGADSGLLAGLVGLGVVAVWGMWQTSIGMENEIPRALWPFAVAVRGFLVIPAVVVGGALGGRARNPDASRKT